MPGLTPLLGLLLTLAPSDAELARRAAVSFRQGCASRERALEARAHFRAAAELYEQLHARGVRSPALYRNLGHAEYLGGRWEQALWAYRSGLRLDPNDRALREGLALARSRVEYPVDGSLVRPEEVWPTWLPRPTQGALLVSIGASYCLACLLATLWWWQRRVALLAGALGSAALLAISLFALWSAARTDAEDRLHPPLVIIAETTLYRGNAASYPIDPSVPTLPRGLEAQLLGRRGGWLRVRLRNGPSGWIPAAAARVVGDDAPSR